jgi:hypothetical protein
MKHLMRYENYTSTERMDDILDKISKYGIDSLSDLDKEFLDSHKTGKEQELHDKLAKSEVETTFEDDLGKFTFELSEVQKIKNKGGELEEIEIIGTLYVPDLELSSGKRVEGRLEGKIIKYSNGTTSLEFEKDGYDVFEFCNGLEYELDSFIDYVVLEIDEKFKYED